MGDLSSKLLAHQNQVLTFDFNAQLRHVKIDGCERPCHGMIIHIFFPITIYQFHLDWHDLIGKPCN